MASEVEYVYVGDYVDGLPDNAETPAVDDRTVVFNSEDGFRKTKSNANALADEASESDLNASSVVEIWTTEGKKKLPADNIALRSTQIRLQNSFSLAFSSSVGYDKDQLTTRYGQLYVFKNAHPAGAWNDDDVTQISLDSYFARLVSLAPEWRQGVPWSAGEIVLYNKRLFQFVNFHAKNVAWDSGDVREIRFSSAISANRLVPFVKRNMLDLSAGDVSLDSVFASDGNDSISSSSSYNISGYIPVNEGNIIVCNIKWRNCRFYTDEKRLHSSVGLSDGAWSFSVPAGVAYIRFSILKSVWSDIMISTQGNLPEVYTPYDGKFYLGHEFLDYPVAKKDTKFFTLENMLNLSADDVLLDSVYASNGNDAITSSVYYNISGYIRVNPSDNIVCNVKWRNCRFYNERKQLHSSIGLSDGTYNFAVPSGVYYVRFCISKSVWNDIMISTQGNLPNNYTPYTGNLVLDKKSLPSSKKSLAKFETSGTIGAEELITMDTCNIVKDFTYSFRVVGNIANVSIGANYSNVFGRWLEIDTTSINVKYGTNGDVADTITHGLNVDNGVFATIYKEGVADEVKISVVDYYGKVCSFETTWHNCALTLFVRNNGSSGSFDCKMSMTPRAAVKPIWIFGDSYMNCYENYGWMHYIVQDYKFLDFMLSARGGENSSQAVADLRRLLNVASAPSIIVWALGMNDSNYAAWNSAFTELKTICADNKITLVLVTIPTTPNVDNDAKNSAIVASGYRYIDFASVVADENSDYWKWYGTANQLIDGDFVHPSSRGAKILAAAFINEFPEITGDM